MDSWNSGKSYRRDRSGRVDLLILENEGDLSEDLGMVLISL